MTADEIRKVANAILGRSFGVIRHINSDYDSIVEIERPIGSNHLGFTMVTPGEKSYSPMHGWLFSDIAYLHPYEGDSSSMTYKGPDATTIMAFRSATGLGVNAAREHIINSPDDLVNRILQAAKQAGNDPDNNLEDPTQHDPEIGPTIIAVLEEESEKAFAEDGWRRGICHFIWKNTKQRLMADYGITWYSPKEMNPGFCFD